jgi:hypothetical protein
LFCESRLEWRPDSHRSSREDGERDSTQAEHELAEVLVGEEPHATDLETG